MVADWQSCARAAFSKVPNSFSTLFFFLPSLSYYLLSFSSKMDQKSRKKERNRKRESTHTP